MASDGAWAITVILRGVMGAELRTDLGQLKNCLRTRLSKYYYPPQCTDSMIGLILLLLAG